MIEQEDSYNNIKYWTARRLSIKALTATPGAISTIPKMDIVEGQNQAHKLSSDLHTIATECFHAHVYGDTHTYTHLNGKKLSIII